MTPESIRSCGRRLVDEVLNQGDLAVADHLIDPCCTGHLSIREPVIGLDRVKIHIVRLRRAFPDVSVRIDDDIVDRDTLVLRLALTGTHSGRPFLGVAARGSPVVVGVVLLCRMNRQGRIREGWIYADQLDILRQISDMSESLLKSSMRKGKVMSYAVISSWTSSPEIFAAAGGQDTLNNVIVPMVKASPGFLRGHWTEAVAADDHELLSYTEYDTEQNAEAMVAMMSSETPPPGVVLPAVGPALSWAKVVQVMASA